MKAKAGKLKLGFLGTHGKQALKILHSLIENKANTLHYIEDLTWKQRKLCGLQPAKEDQDFEYYLNSLDQMNWPNKLSEITNKRPTKKQKNHVHSLK